MARAYATTPIYNKLWALKKDATSFSFVATVTSLTKGEVAAHKEHFLKFYPDSVFKIQKTQPKEILN